MPRHYKRTLDDGTIQKQVYEDDPGISIPQWELDVAMNAADPLDDDEAEPVVTVTRGKNWREPTRKPGRLKKGM